MHESNLLSTKANWLGNVMVSRAERKVAAIG